MKKKLLAFLESPLGKFLIETLRWGVCVGVSAILNALADGIGNFGINEGTVVIVAAALRYVDAALHKSGWAEKGLVRF